MPGKRMNSIAKGRRDVYEKLRSQGLSKTRAAKIANAGKTFASRSQMARKGWRTRRAKGR